MDDLKKKARAAGIWNMFLPRNHFKEGMGFTNVEYGLMAEQLGRSPISSEVRFQSPREVCMFHHFDLFDG